MLKTPLLALVILGLSSCNSEVSTLSKSQLYYDCMLKNMSESKDSSGRYDIKVICARKHHQIVPPEALQKITASGTFGGYGSYNTINGEVNNRNEDWVISEIKMQITVGTNTQKKHTYIRNMIAEATRSQDFYIDIGGEFEKEDSGSSWIDNGFSWEILQAKGIKIGG